MASKPKKRRVPKVVSEIPAPRKSQESQVNPDELIRRNGELVEELFSSRPWQEIALPLLQECIAGVSGRFTNGRFHRGSLTKHDSRLSYEQLAGYQMALEDFHDRLHSFIEAKDRLREEKREAAEARKAPIYNPFLEGINEAEVNFEED